MRYLHNLFTIPGHSEREGEVKWTIVLDGPPFLRPFCWLSRSVSSVTTSVFRMGRLSRPLRPARRRHPYRHIIGIGPGVLVLAQSCSCSSGSSCFVYFSCAAITC